MSAKKMFEVALVLTAADKATRIINDATVNAQKKIKGMSELGDKSFALGRGAGAAGIAMAGILALPLKAAADMESMNVSLKTSFQGNAKAAKQAFDDINSFAAKTPFELQEVMMGFIKLKNMGLDPSEEALTAYGNTASAMGKSLNDMVEAVADAATGEFERLKEFGIKASSQGDKVSFMFQGVKTTVGKNAKEIEQYLKFVGNVKFAGGIEAQSKTVKGMFSTLKDGVVMTAAKIGTTFLPRIKELMNQITPVIDKISVWVSKNPKLTESILKGVAAVMLLSFAISGASFAFGGLFKAISFGMTIFSGLRTMIVALRAAQMAYTFSLLAGTGGVGAMTAAMTALNLAFLLSPITWIILAIVAAVGLLIYFWKPISGFFMKIWDSVKSIFIGVWKWIKDWGWMFLGPIGLIIQFWDKISGFFSNIWVKIKNVFVKALDYYLYLPKMFYKIGVNIISSIWEGISSKAAMLFKKVNEIGHGISQSFKKVLGIASPSKVFMEYGMNITEGARSGIDRGKSRLNATSAGIAKGISPGGGKSGGIGGGGITVNFAPVINGGGNSSDIASQMKALIPEIIRQIEDGLARKQRLQY